MKIILKQNINKLGKKGEIKNVANGYAKNFLIPNKYAVLASTGEVEKNKQEQIKQSKEAEEELYRFQKIVSDIDGFELEIVANVNEEGNLFGSITAKHIADSLQENGFQIEKKYIVLKNPIKEIGEYDVGLEFPHNLEANIKVIITEGEK